MLRLPNSCDPAGGARTAVGETSALAIEAALLEDDPAQAAPCLLRALAADPALADWACRAAESPCERESPGDLARLAAWLAVNLLDLVAPLATTPANDCGEGSSPENQKDVASGVDRRLARLIARLLRLRSLECDFAAALEREKLEATKSLAYGAGHEINNPLANISARAQALLKQETDPERRRSLAAINSQVFRAHEMIADLMLFSRPPKLDPQPADVGPLVAELAAECRPEAELRGAAIDYQSPDHPVIALVDEVQFKVALRALVLNSLEALGAAGTVSLSAELSADQRAARIVVADDGPGVAAEQRQRIFDPFFSGREAGRGLGFGLSKCWRIVTDHGGQIRLDPASPALPRRGACFVIELPAAHSAALKAC